MFLAHSPFRKNIIKNKNISHDPHFVPIRLVLMLSCLIFHFFKGCPDDWIDASYMDLGCIMFKGTISMTAPEALEYCVSQYNSHLVEIFTPIQQEFLRTKAMEIEELSGTKRHWWIGK